MRFTLCFIRLTNRQNFGQNAIYTLFYQAYKPQTFWPKCNLHFVLSGLKTGNILAKMPFTLYFIRLTNRQYFGQNAIYTLFYQAYKPPTFWPKCHLHFVLSGLQTGNILAIMPFTLCFIRLTNWQHFDQNAVYTLFYQAYKPATFWLKYHLHFVLSGLQTGNILAKMPFTLCFIRLTNRQYFGQNVIYTLFYQAYKLAIFWPKCHLHFVLSGLQTSNILAIMPFTLCFIRLTNRQHFCQNAVYTLFYQTYKPTTFFPKCSLHFVLSDFQIHNIFANMPFTLCFII